MKRKHARGDFGAFLDRTIVPRLKKADKAELLIVTCVDFRTAHWVFQSLEERGLRYQHLIVVGGSLGLFHKKEWRTTFFDQVDFALKQQPLRQVLFLDHRHCGAQHVLDKVAGNGSGTELATRRKKCAKAMRAIAKKFPELKGNVHALLLPDEHVEELAKA